MVQASAVAIFAATVLKILWCAPMVESTKPPCRHHVPPVPQGSFHREQTLKEVERNERNMPPSPDTEGDGHEVRAESFAPQRSRNGRRRAQRRPCRDAHLMAT